MTGVARRYGISRYRLSSWRSLVRQGKLVAPSLAKAEPAGAYAGVEEEERHSVVGFIFEAGTVHTAASMSTSAQVASRTTPDRAAVRIVNFNASRVET